MEVYTHNLKIILVDRNGNIILDNEFLDEIKNTLCQLNTKKLQWNSQNIDITIEWHKKELDNIEKQFMGDLFSNPIYEHDSIIVNHTTQVISNINNKSNYEIKFYIYRLVGDKIISSNSYGVV
jgi:predicted metal-dependent hydrolase